MARWRVMLLALGLDLLLGEPPGRRHPVVWMGRLVEGLERRAPEGGPWRRLAYGAAAETVCLGAALFPAWLAERLLRGRWWLGDLAVAVALKPAFALRALFESFGRVERALRDGDLPEARREVGRVVSRRVDDLDEERVAAAAVESLAENACDSVVAPLLYYAALGLPGAYLYRAANTLDAMWGYRGRYEHLGKVPARVDDLLNLLPSRLAAAAVAITCRPVGGDPRRAWSVAARDSARTASPNAGWPMSAVAGALDLRLEKVGHYVLNPGGRSPTAADMGRARRVVAAALAGAVAGLVLVEAVIGVAGNGRRRRGSNA